MIIFNSSTTYYYDNWIFQMYFTYLNNTYFSALL